MKFPRKQRVIVLTLLYVCAAALMICGVWSTAFPRRFAESRHSFEEAPHLVSGDDDTAILSSSEIWTAGARSLSSTDDATEESAQEAEQQTSEDEGDLQSSLPQLYHVPQIFALNYEEMTKNMRVYIYPNSQTGSMNDSYEYDATNGNNQLGNSEEATTTGFFNILAKGKDHQFLTSDPDEAHLFFLPVSIDALHSALGPDGVGNHLRHYIESIRGNYTFWDRSLGADHFYLASRGYETVNHRNNLELTKNAVQVACSPLAPNQAFYPHKDIVIPHYQNLPASSSSSPRSTLAYINLDLAQSSLLPEAWKSDSDFVVEASNGSPDASVFESSKFCVSLSMRNVVDALRHGCVPVVVSDSIIYDLPFQDALNWHEFSVVIGTEEMADVKSFFTSMSDAKYAKMQYLGLQASKHMEWNDPPAAYDAFHMTMFELWMRRHSVKYSRRSAEEWKSLEFHLSDEYLFYGVLVVIVLFLIPQRRVVYSTHSYSYPAIFRICCFWRAE
ncbi:hypothetical protein M758_6G017800 [Ceratodon purpureus]|nr:hypothetical protein M758_6G017800 [Ceratodon purpureus]